MSLHFKPCVSRNACSEDGTHCRACGRSHGEVAKTRTLVNQLTEFLLETGYDNQDDFFDYLNKKVGKKIRHAKTET